MSENNILNHFAAFAFIQNPIAMLIVDENATILHINDAFNQLTGYDDLHCLGKCITFLDSHHNEVSLYDLYTKDTIHPSNVNSFERYLLCNNDNHILVRKNIKHMIHDGVKYTILTFDDITEQQRILEHYQHLAMHDSLTGLANRVLLEDFFHKAEYRAIRSQRKMALLLCDINGFKVCNDKYGHDFGDVVLKVVANKFEELLRITDTVARYGGDEFVLILEDIPNGDHITQIVKTIKKAFPIAVAHDGKMCQVNMSIGSACFPDDGNNFNALIQVADQNMYKEKKEFYGSGQSFHSKER